MNPTPPDWPRLSVSVFYRDAAAAIDWLVRAFGFRVRLRIEGEGGRIEHSELTFGEAVIMVGQEPEDAATAVAWKATMKSPRSVGGANTQNVMLYVDDVDRHCAVARAAGAEIRVDPAVHDYGDDFWVDKSYGAVDPEGHLWWICQRLRTPKVAPWADG